MTAALKTALKTLLLTLDEFEDNQEGVVLADPRVLDMGYDHMIIIWGGAMSSGNAAGQTIDHTNSLLFQAFVRFVDDPTASAALDAFTKSIVDMLDVYPTLDGQTDITIETLAGSEPMYIKDAPPANGGPYFLMREFTIEFSERVALNGGEY